MLMSIEPKMEMRSAIFQPRDISGSAPRLMNDGQRHHPGGALLEDAVAGEQAMHLLHPAGRLLADATHLRLEELGEILLHRARPVVVEGHALAADVLEHVEDLLAPVEGPHHAGDQHPDVLSVDAG